MFNSERFQLNSFSVFNSLFAWKHSVPFVVHSTAVLIQYGSLTPYPSPPFCGDVRICPLYISSRSAALKNQKAAQPGHCKLKQDSILVLSLIILYLLTTSAAHAQRMELGYGTSLHPMEIQEQVPRRRICRHGISRAGDGIRRHGGFSTRPLAHRAGTAYRLLA
jgi:hypothetical protein